MTIPRALFPFALLATLTASVPKISEEDYAGMPEAFATYTRANLAWLAVTGLEVLLRLRRDDIMTVYERSLLIQEDREAAAGQLGLIRGALSLPLDPSPGDLEAIAEELGPAGAKLLKEILEEDAADAAPDL